MSDIDVPIYVARVQIASAISLIVQLERSNEDGKRRVVRIAEQRGLDRENQYQLTDLFKAEWVRLSNGQSAPLLKPTGEVASFAHEVTDRGWDHQITQSRPVWGLK